MRSAILDIFDHLEAMHAWRGWHWDANTDAFEVAVGAILVQNTAWTNVEHALTRLREADVLDPGRLRTVPVATIEELVRPSGQYRQKARKLRSFLDLIDEAGSFEALLALPPEVLRERLLATWGIGEETADVIVLYCAKQPAFVVDAYTKRVFSRLEHGPGEAAPYSEWQRFFTAELRADADEWARFHALIVLHAKHACRKRSPRCGECTLAPRCTTATRLAGGEPAIGG